jgi:hypothetical protein
MVLRIALIAKKTFILINGSPKPVFQYHQLAEDYCLGNSKLHIPKNGPQNSLTAKKPFILMNDSPNQPFIP